MIIVLVIIGHLSVLHLRGRRSPSSISDRRATKVKFSHYFLFKDEVNFVALLLM
jgi:hypothetical protein